MVLMGLNFRACLGAFVPLRLEMQVRLRLGCPPYALDVRDTGQSVDYASLSSSGSVTERLLPDSHGSTDSDGSQDDGTAEKSPEARGFSNEKENPNRIQDRFQDRDQASLNGRDILDGGSKQKIRAP